MSIPAPSPRAAFACPSLLVASTLALIVLLCGSLRAQPFVPDGAMQLSVPGADFSMPYAQGDLNGDGWLDVAVAFDEHHWQPELNHYVATLMGNGAGFEPPTIYAHPDFIANDLELADVNGDGLLDLVAVGQAVIVPSFPGRLAIFPNGGEGVLGPPSYLPLTDIPKSLAVAELDGDDLVDLVVVPDPWPELHPFPSPDPFSPYLLVLSSDGDGGFAPATTIDLPHHPEAVDVGDVDDDGAVDMVVASEELFLLLNDGLGGFDVSNIPRKPVVAPWGLEYELWWYALASIEDVDADGHPDVITADAHSCGFPGPIVCSAWTLSVLLGDGSGVFDGGTAVVSRSGEVMAPPSSILAGDLDEDGDLDVLLLGSFPNIILLENQGGLIFDDYVPNYPHYALSTGGLLDYDGDGSLDPVSVAKKWDPVAEYYVPRVTWSRNNFDDRSTTFEHHASVKSDSGYHLAEDMDGDGDTDVVAVTGWPYELRVYANDGGGGLAPLSAAPVSFWVDSAQIADVDGDDDMDVVVMGAEVEVFLNDGAGVFVSVGPPVIGTSGEAFTLGDLDDDGLLEMIINRESSGLSVFRQMTPGVFELGETYGLGDYYVQDIQLGDTDGDGHVDVLFESTSSGIPGFGVLAGDGLGGLVEPAQIHGFAPGDTVQDVVVGDLDDDGLADVTLTCTLDDTHHLGVYLAQAGSVLPVLAQDVVTESAVRIEAITDLDVDGAPDVLGVSGPGWQEPAEVTVWNNDGAGLLTVTGSFASGEISEILIGDVDGDGFPELVTATAYEELVTVRWNDGEGWFPDDATWSWLPGEPGWGPALLTPMDANGTADFLRDESFEWQQGLSVYLSVHEGTPPGPCELDFNGDGFVTQADHAQIAPEVDGIYYATWTYLYRPDWFELYFPDVDPAMLDWNGDGEITLEEVAPNVPFSTESYYWQWLVYLLRDWIIENYGIDYYAEWWPDSGCE